GARGLNWHIFVERPTWWFRLERRLPSLKPESRARRVDTGRPIEVFAKVQENVDPRVAHFAWRSKGACVVSVAKHVPLAAEKSVERSRETNREPCYPAREGTLVGCFGDEMNVVGLHGEMHDAKPFTPGLCERTAQRHEDGLFAQAWQTAGGA